jgi:hypothetical protein
MLISVRWAHRCEASSTASDETRRRGGGRGQNPADSETFCNPRVHLGASK